MPVIYDCLGTFLKGCDGCISVGIQFLQIKCVCTDMFARLTLDESQFKHEFQTT